MMITRRYSDPQGKFTGNLCLSFAGVEGSQPEVTH